MHQHPVRAASAIRLRRTAEMGGAQQPFADGLDKIVPKARSMSGASYAATQTDQYHLQANSMQAICAVGKSSIKVWLLKGVHTRQLFPCTYSVHTLDEKQVGECGPGGVDFRDKTLTVTRKPRLSTAASTRSRTPDLILWFTCMKSHK